MTNRHITTSENENSLIQSQQIELISKMKSHVNYGETSFPMYTLTMKMSRNERNDKMKGLLRTAVDTHNMPLLTSLLTQKPIKFHLELSAYWASKIGNYDALIELDKHIKLKWTELIEIAARNGHQKIVDFILDKNNNKTLLLNTAFESAIMSNNVDLVKDLMTRGVELEWAKRTFRLYYAFALIRDPHIETYWWSL